jgi:molybdate transport system ATP-binding protein
MLVSLQHVNVDLNGRRVLHDVTWALERGAHWAVLGPNGAGKSTFLRLVRGEVWPAPVAGGRRVYAFDGEPSESPIGVKQKIALVSAEQQTRYMRTEWHMRVWQVVLTGLTDSDLIYQHPTPEQLAYVDAILAELDITDLREADFHKLSQGQLRKALIARALVRKPPVLICDEIGVGLDARTRHELFDVIARAVDGGTQLLMTSHRREELLPAIDNRADIVDGRVTCSPMGTARAPAAPRVAVQSPAATSARNVSTTDPGGSFVLDIRNATVALDEGATVILRDVTWRIDRGEHWRITGDNGAGKTTLLKLIMGDLWPAHGGSIDRFGERGFRDVWAIKRRIGYVSQELQARYHHDLTARQVVGTGFNASVGWLSTLTPEQNDRVDEALAALGIAHLAGRNLQQMSYGQARKVLVARAIVNDPVLLILDEVFDGLDAQFRADLAARFEHMATHTTLLLVSHFDGDRLPCITHTLQTEDGRVCAR